MHKCQIINFGNFCQCANVCASCECVCVCICVSARFVSRRHIVKVIPEMGATTTGKKLNMKINTQTNRQINNETSSPPWRATHTPVYQQ